MIQDITILYSTLPSFSACKACKVAFDEVIVEVALLGCVWSEVAPSDEVVAFDKFEVGGLTEE